MSLSIRFILRVQIALLCLLGMLGVVTASDPLLPGRLIPYGLGPHEFGVGDFDGDGKQDILVATSNPNGVVSPAGLSLLHGHGDGRFDAQPASSSWYYLYSPLLVTDLNGDGRLDAILSRSISTTDGQRGSVVILLGRGDGTFASAIDTVIGPSAPFSLGSGDFNGDGIKDLIALSEGEHSCSLYGCYNTLYYMWIILGNGDGSFHAPMRMTSVGAFPNQVAVADFNGDGLDDLAVADGYGNIETNHLGLSLFLSNGDGTFRYRGDAPAQLVPSFVRVGDLNLDGFPDLIVDNDISGNNDLFVLLGRGDGAFDPPVGYRADSGVSVLVADISGDGAPDLVVLNTEKDEVVILINDGKGVFTSAGSHVVGHAPVTLGAADFNGDGRIDLAVGTLADSDLTYGSRPAGTQEICLLIGKGGGSFDSSSVYETGDPLSSTRQLGEPTLATGDVNGDAMVDVVSTNPSGNDLSVLLGRRDGSFEPERRFATGQGPSSIAVADYNGDGKVDIVTGNVASKDLSFLRGRGDGTFTSAISVPLGYAPTSVTAADFNQDGRADLAVATTVHKQIDIYYGMANGSLSGPFPINTDGYPYRIVAADANGDGHQDIVVVEGPNNKVVTLVLGNGSGAFLGDQPIITLSSPYNIPIAIAVAAADYNGDGRLDIAVADEVNWQVHIFLQASSGAFGDSVILATGVYPTSLAAGDLNGDGRPDLVVGDESPFSGGYGQGGDLSIHLQAAGGGFVASARRYASGAGPHAVLLADFDSDGLLDIAVASRPGVVVLLNERDVDHDGIADTIDSCIDSDGDGAGDPEIASNVCRADNCPTVPNTDQGDMDNDGVGDVCDNCPTVHDPEQFDWNHDGSGDACQPVLSIESIRQDGGTVLEARLTARDPQNESLSGRIKIRRNDFISVTLRDALATYDCTRGYLPQGVLGQGIGFGNEYVGSSYLFDLDSVVECSDGRQDYTLALGPCDEPTSDFHAYVYLAGLPLPAIVCVRPVHDDVGGTEWTILSIGHDSLSAILHDTHGDVEVPFTSGIPRNLDISMLVVSASYRLDITVTDGNTVPVSAAGTFTYQGESIMALLTNSAPRAAAVVPGAVECDSAGAGTAILDGSRSTDADSTPGTQDDIAFYEWYEDYGLASQRSLGTGMILSVVLPLGQHALTLKVTDRAGESSTATIGVTVADTNAPTLVCPSTDLTTECADPAGAAVTLLATATDACGGSVTITNDHTATGADASATYPLGTTTVEFRAVDGSGNASTCSVPVTVVDTTPPVLDCPRALPAVECQGAGGAYVTLAATAHDLCGGVTVANNRTSNGADASGLYLLGATQVGFQATDAAGNPVTCTTAVTVLDTLPPSLTLHTDPGTLWPPNHDMTSVRVWWEASDLCDPASVAVQLTAATTSEPDDAPGNDDGATTGDIQGADIGTPDTSLLLRAERNGKGPGRVYALTYRAVDGSGNATPALATVTVPHDEGQGPEPLLMQVEPATTGSTSLRIYWPSIVGATGYDVITGDLASWHVENGVLNLGTVQVLVQSTTLTSVSEAAGSATPVVGQGFFYLIQSRTDQGAAGYGTETGPWPRVPESCDGGCPGTAIATTTGGSGSGQTTRR